MKRKISLFLLPLVLLAGILAAQPSRPYVQVVVSPDHDNWLYKQNESTRFTITVLKDGNPLRNVTLVYQVGPEKMDPFKRDSVVLDKGVIELTPFSLKQPGFLQCVATAWFEGKSYRGLATTGYTPENIKPTVEYPSDFNAFWSKAKQSLTDIPLETRMVLLPERCTEKVNVYHVSFQNVGGSRVYGILCVPREDGKYPALLRVPGAGVRPYTGDVSIAEKGIIILEIGIHGIPVNLEPVVYDNLRYGALNGYWASNLDDKDRYYYKRVYLGCVRANDFLTSLPEYDGKNLGVTGGSQGGALSIVTAALDTRVKYLTAYYPALSDVTGYLHGRAGGWPHLFSKNNLSSNNTKERINTCGYYDVVNFARQVKIPGMYSWGFNDETCPPTSMYAAYNVISGPKELFLALETGHWTFPEQTKKLTDWMAARLQNESAQ